MSYAIETNKLKDAIRVFLNEKGIGQYKDEAHMRSELAQHLFNNGYAVEEEREFEMLNGDKLRADIVVSLDGYIIPIELKYRNTSIDEYIEDEEKCRRYIEDLASVPEACYIFVSNIDHKDYRTEEWIECQGNPDYHYLMDSELYLETDN